MGKKGKTRKPKSTPGMRVASATPVTEQGSVAVLLVVGAADRSVEPLLALVRTELSRVAFDVVAVGRVANATAHLPEYVRMLPSRGGLSAALNDGMAASSADTILIIDSEVEPREGSLRSLLKAARMAGVGVAGGRVLTDSGRIGNAGFDFDEESGLIARWSGSSASYAGALQESQVVAVDLCATLVRRATYETIGPFDEALDSPQWVAADFCLRARSARLRVAYVPGCQVVDHRRSLAMAAAAGELDPAEVMRILGELDTVHSRYASIAEPRDAVFSRIAEHERRFEKWSMAAFDELGVTHADSLLRRMDRCAS